MNTTTKRCYIKTVQRRYLKASKKQKGLILDEICANLSIHRKAANRLIRSDLHKKRKLKDPLYIYSKRTLFLLEQIWLNNDCPSSTLLKAAIADYLPHFK